MNERAVNVRKIDISEEKHRSPKRNSNDHLKKVFPILMPWVGEGRRDSES